MLVFDNSLLTLCSFSPNVHRGLREEWHTHHQHHMWQWLGTGQQGEESDSEQEQRVTRSGKLSEKSRQEAIQKQETEKLGRTLRKKFKEAGDKLEKRPTTTARSIRTTASTTTTHTWNWQVKVRKHTWSANRGIRRIRRGVWGRRIRSRRPKKHPEIQHNKLWCCRYWWLARGVLKDGKHQNGL